MAKGALLAVPVAIPAPSLFKYEPLFDRQTGRQAGAREGRKTVAALDATIIIFLSSAAPQIGLTGV